jgi:signal transduction histidine kinase
MADTPAIPWWKYFRGLAPVILFWALLVGWLAYLLTDRTRIGTENDEASLREWIDESRAFRKTLPELIREYLNRLGNDEGNVDAIDVRYKAEEIAEQLKAMADPIRIYQGQLPLFPEVYRLEVVFLNQPEEVKPIIWDSPVPRPRGDNQAGVYWLVHPILGYDGSRAAEVRCEYRIHAFNRLQRDEEQRQALYWIVGGVILGGSILALSWVYFFLRRERRREVAQLEAEKAREHAEVLMLEARIEAQEAERMAEEANLQLLEQRLEGSRTETRAAEAEAAALEMKSQIYASIGIMAGSYAHNIKNLLVRPNDLIVRCLEADGLKSDQSQMLQEVKSTLGTVTERLQMILRTVRRDPSKAEMMRLDLNALLHETEKTWTTIAREKWKMNLQSHLPSGHLFIRGDLSHLQQTIENLIFNARDATFEMRNQVRESARHNADPSQRKQAIIEAAAWKGSVEMTAYRLADKIILEIKDNGIGMTEEVRAKCLETHFSTKRDNALYEGYNAGMGLGLSFVSVVLEHHEAELTIESQPGKGALFRVRFPVSDSE